MIDPSIHFSISFSEAQAHYVDIAITISNFNQPVLELALPVWTPGSYLVREYSRHIEQVEATDENGAIKCQKVTKNTWRIEQPVGKVVVQYKVYGFEVSVRTNMINADRAFLSPAATFLHIKDQLALPATIEVCLPEDWTNISTGLTRLADRKNTFFADNFDILYDSPIEIGNQDIWHFEAANIQHEFAMVGGGNYDKERLSTDIRKIVEEETRIWGENPNDRYVFITHNYQTGGGGLEHLNSTVLGASRNAYQNATSYKNFLSLVAHEYFHLWNVKRLRPRALGPFNYDEENYTTGLWIMEGFTSYYDNLIVRRCGFFSVEEYLHMLANEFNLVYNRPGYQLQSAAQASFDTWIKQYRPDENSANTSISYYNKGAMLATALDLHILAETEGEKRLDDVIRAAYQVFYKEKQRGFDEDEFQQLAEEVTGVDLSTIFAAAHHTEELDYQAYFAAVGYRLVDRNAGNNELALGIKVSHQDGRILIKQVERGSGAWDAGLSVDDELIAINGNRLDVAGKELDFIQQSSQADEVLDVLVARDGLIRNVYTPIRHSSKQDWVIEALPDASTAAKALGRIWLSV